MNIVVSSDVCVCLSGVCVMPLYCWWHRVGYGFLHAGKTQWQVGDTLWRAVAYFTVGSLLWITVAEISAMVFYWLILLLNAAVAVTAMLNLCIRLYFVWSWKMFVITAITDLFTQTIGSHYIKSWRSLNLNFHGFLFRKTVCLWLILWPSLL